MKKRLKSLLTLLLILTMICQTAIIYATDTTSNIVMDVPQTVKSSGNYMEIPVFYKEQVVNQIMVLLEKQSGLDKGYATFKVKGYAYRNGTNVTLGILFGYYAKDGTWQEDFLDQAAITSLEGKYEGIEWKNDSKWIGWQKEEYWTKVVELPFTPGQEQNKGNTRVRFITATNLGGAFKDRDTNKDVKLTDAPPTEDIVVTQDGLTITKSVKSLEDLKNVWEVELKIEGKNIVVSEDTEVVLVLDKSGSMGQGVIDPNHIHTDKCYKKELKCTKNHWLSQWHTEECYIKVLDCQGYTLQCSQEHTHVLPKDFEANPCYLNRADKVKEASYAFIDSLKELEKVKLDVVVYAGYAKQLTGLDLKTAIENEFNTIGEVNNSYGTNTGLGIQTANELLSKSANAKANKVIVVISDGESTQPNNGAKLVDSLTAANTAKGQNIVLYTIGAGIASGSNGARELSNCASTDKKTGSKKFYLADDASNALTNILVEIAGEIQEAGSTCILSEALTNEFQIVMDSSLANKGVSQVALGDLVSIDWANKKIVYTQGQVLTAENKQVKWEIGPLTENVPAVIRYRVNMKSGTLGVSYPINSQSQIQYVNNEGQDKVLDIPSISKKALWAGIRFNIYNVEKDGTEVLVSAGTSDRVWAKVPEDSAQLSSLKIGLKTKVDATKLEVSLAGSATLEELSGAGLISPGPSEAGKDKMLGIKIGSGNYHPDGEVPLTQVVNEVGIYQQNLELNATVQNGYNVIQPEGVTNIGAELKFGEYTKDITYKVNVQPLIDEKMSGNLLMDFKVEKATVGVEKLLSDDGLGHKTWQRIDTDYYQLVSPQATDQELTVEFNKESSAKPFIANSGEVYRVIVYIPTHMQQNIKYNEYIQHYIKISSNNTKTVATKVIATSRIKEAITINGIYYEAQYANLSKDLAVTLKYLEISKIQ